MTAMPNPDGDIAAFLRKLVLRPASDRPMKPFVGYDECLNDRRIAELARSLIRGGLIEVASPLWYQPRHKNGVVVVSILGGLDRDSRLREPNSFIPDVGTRIDGYSWSDFRVVQMLVVNFVSRDKLILLSANTEKKRRDGLRRILNDVVAPVLAYRQDPLYLTALFKKPKTNIADYCLRVTDFLKAHQDRGYVERLL